MVLEALGLQVVHQTRWDQARALVGHAVRGCRPVPLFTVRGGRIVPAGRVCPLCMNESSDV